jgi:eukaryotic-like serine/threonine-protein kinase
MQMTEPMVLPVDLLILPVQDLPEQVRQQLKAEEGDFALTRPNSRTPSRIIDAAAADLLKEFRSPATIVEAVIRYSRDRKIDPEQTLEEAYPLLERLAGSHLLVPSSSEEAKKIQASLKVPSRFMEFEVVRCLQSLDDTELYQLKGDDDQFVALKLGRSDAHNQALRMFDREESMLTRLHGESTPCLLRSGKTDNGQRYLIMDWCPGQDCATVATHLRSQVGIASRLKLLALCSSILEAYVRLHQKNVIHSDIHPRNVLIDDSGDPGYPGQPRIIDFGFARISGIEHEYRAAQRAGVAFFFEPEYARAALRKQTPPASSALGEQYALAALLYSLITGNYYLDFSLEKDEMLRQIAEDPPLPFIRRGVPAWPELEQIFAKALSKRAPDRFPTLAEFAAAINALAQSQDIAIDEVIQPSEYPDAKQMLHSILERMDVGGSLFDAGIDAAPSVSVTYGSAGIAYAFYRLACTSDDPQLLATADLWSARSAKDVGRPDAFYSTEIEITPETVGRISPYHTASGIYAVQLLIARAQGDLLTQQQAIEAFLSAAQQAPCDSLDVTLGRSGPLLAASFLLNAIRGCKYIEGTPLTTFGNQILEDIWAELDTFKPIRECRQIAYSGAAHGWAGILFATLNWCKVTETPFPRLLEERLEQLAHMAEHFGRCTRWKWSVRPMSAAQGSPYMAGWCNGSAGFVFLWTLAHNMLGRPEYSRLAEGAAYDAWESESPLGNLCCGYAGQAYALLNMYKHSGDPAWLYRAQALAQRAARAILDMPAGETFQDLVLRGDSLYKGELGVALLTEELNRPEHAAMPFFELES